MKKKLKSKVISFNKLLLATFISLFFINGIVYVLDNKMGLFNAVHSIVLRNISSAVEVNNTQYTGTADSTVVLISNKMFEKESNYKAPFDKKVMTDVITKIAQDKPKALVLDFDISPYYNFTNPRNDYLTNPLYIKLKEMAKDIPVIVPFLFMGETDENNMLKLFWIRDMCSANIHFATPLVSSEIGIVLQYNDYKQQMNLLVDDLLKGKETKSLCQRIETLTDFNLKKIKDGVVKEYHQSEKLPINFQAINNSTINIDTASDLDKYDLKDKTVYLGSGYGFTDLFVTPYGEKYGVEIHSAIYHSLNNQIAPANITISVISDIAIGVFFGMFLSWTIAKRANIQTTNGLIFNNLAIVFIVAFFIMISMYLSAVLFHSIFIWLNPIPIIIGMFIDMMIGLDHKEFKDSLKTNWLKVGGKIIFVLVGILSVIGVI